MSRAEYYRSVLEQVLAAVRIHPSQKHLPFDTLRQQVEALPEDRRLTTGVADFWLELGPKLGRKRRRDPAVHNPFYPDGKKMVAAKSQIANWDDQWRKLEAAKHLKAARTVAAQENYNDLTANPCPWMLGWSDGREVILGHAAWLPAAFTDDAIASQSDGYDIRWFRPSEALRLPWRDPSEAHTWLAIVQACHRMEEADLERIRFDLDSGEAKGEHTGIDRI